MSTTHRRSCIQDAEIETDPNELVDKVSEAKMAIVARYRELIDAADSEEERQSLAEATRVLRKIEVERLGFPQIEDEHGNRIC